MSVNKPQFPNWDGTAPNRPNRLVDKAPDFEDWDQVTAEVLAHQDAVQQNDFSVQFTDGAASSPGVGGSQPPSAFKGTYLLWGFSVTDPDNGGSFVLPRDATQLSLTVFSKFNGFLGRNWFSSRQKTRARKAEPHE